MKQQAITPLVPEFSFAGIDFPKYVWTLPCGSRTKRLESFRNYICGPYQHKPKPIQHDSNGAFFYLGSDFMPGLRWQWCDEVKGSGIDHTGWFTDDQCDEKIRGLVFRLPKSRGFLAGWSMGKSMASEVEAYVYHDEDSAARAADSLAKSVADKERDYQASERAKIEAQEALELETAMLDNE